MNWSDYEAIWKRQELPVGAGADLTSLRDTFETKRRKLAAALLLRDWIEIAACGVVEVSYAAYWHRVGAAGWPMAFAMFLVLGVALFFLRERRRARSRRLDPSPSLLAKIEDDLAELRHQHRLLLKVWVWYLAPCAGAMAIHLGVIARQAPAGSPLREPLALVAVAASLAALLGLVGLLNRHNARKRIAPRMAELEKLRASLLAAE